MKYLYILLSLPVFFLRPCFVNAQPKTGLQKIQGNWLRPADAVWMFGFYPRYAMVEGAFWNYKNILGEKDHISLVLQKDNVKKTLSLQLLPGGDSMRVAMPGGKTCIVSRKPDGSPDFSHGKKTAFPHPLIHPDTVHLKGLIAGYNKHGADYSYVQIIYDPLLEENQKTFLAPIDSLGRFRINFPLLNPQEIMLKFGKALIEWYGIPGRSLMLSIDPENNGALLFAGETALLNTEIYHFGEMRSKQFPFSVKAKKIRSLDPAAFKQFRLHEMEQQLQLLRRYTERHHAGKNFAQQSEMHIRYEAADDLLRYRWLNPRFKTKPWIPSGDYLDFLNKIPLSNPLGATTSEYLAFLKEYADMKKQQYQLSEYTVSLSLEQLLQQRKDTDNRIDPGALALLTKFADLEKGGDSTARRQFMQAKKDSIQFFFKKYRDVMQEYADQALDDVLTKRRSRFEQEFLDPENAGIAGDIILARTAMEKIARGQILTPGRLTFYRENIADTGLYAAVQRSNVLLAATLSGNAVPAGINFLRSIKEAQDSLFEKLIAPYKGNVVYIDLWAPWCGPCMAEMPRSKILEQKFEGRKVVFLYLCVQCRETKWKNTVKSLQLSGEHYRLSDDEFALLSHKFQISGIPRYILVDRSGKVAEPDTDRPDSDLVIIDKIKGLLKRP